MSRTINWYERAETRARHSPTLKAHIDIILYDWNESDEHYRWCATAPVSEVAAWAKAIAYDEAEAARIDAALDADADAADAQLAAIADAADAADMEWEREQAAISGWDDHGYLLPTHTR